MQKIELSVVTITYNEIGNIGRLIDAINIILKQNNLNGEIIIVDDNSPDGTAGLIKEKMKKFDNIVLIERTEKLGIGSAYYTGISKASGDVVITMDADFSHNPDVLMDMYNEAKQGKVVSGSRYLTNLDFHTKWYRFVGTTILNKWLKLLFRLGINDHTNGYLAVKKDTLIFLLEKMKRVNIFPFEKILYGVPIFTFAKKLNIPITEIQAKYIFRTEGVTKINTYDGCILLIENILYSFKILKALRNLEF
ncbi:MAG TPA: glycosyltransferase [bacterium]|nr:glycosyltransferase [bacterium]